MPFNPVYTFSSAKTELQARLGGRTDLGTRLDRWLDSAQQRLAVSMIAMEAIDIVSFTFTTVASQSIYSLSQIIPQGTDIIGIRVMRNDTTGVRMRRFPWQEGRSISLQAAGPPLRWARWGYSLFFDPKPDTSGPYTILMDYRRQPVQGTMEVPNHYQEHMITIAEHYAWKALMKFDKAQAAFQMLPKQIQALVEQPFDYEQWDSFWDDDQVIAPQGFTWPYRT